MKTQLFSDEYEKPACESVWYSALSKPMFDRLKTLPAGEMETALNNLKKEDFSHFKNHCGSRACPVCVRYRIGVLEEQLKQSFGSGVKTIQHVGLTFPNLEKFAKADKKHYGRKLKQFIFRLNNPYDEKTEKRVCRWCKKTFHFRDGCRDCDLWKKRDQLFGVSILDVKFVKHDQKSRIVNNYNVHYHLAVANWCISHKAVSVLWSWIMGEKINHTFVRYNKRKKIIINYFARRVAMSGMYIDNATYEGTIKNSRLFNCFGYYFDKDGEKVYFTVLGTLAEKNEETALKSGFVVIRTLYLLLGEDKPPPDAWDLSPLLWYVKQKISEYIVEERRKNHPYVIYCSGGILPRDVPTSPRYNPPHVIDGEIAEKLYGGKL